VALQGEVPAGAQLWLSNHLSWLDPLVYLSLRPSQVLAKSEVAGYPGIGAGALKAGLRFVNRENVFNRAGALRRMSADLRAGEDLLLFPEGTTTCGPSLAPLQEGGLRVAYRLGVRTLTFRLDCADAHYPWVGDDTLLPHLNTMVRSRRTRVTVRPGRILDPRDCPDEEHWVRLIRNQLEPTFEVAHAV
jgi:1-acyl-sn-glycerol-3-phosphate acyltransferase